jgi:hypothetical protein
VIDISTDEARPGQADLCIEIGAVHAAPVRHWHGVERRRP